MTTTTWNNLPWTLIRENTPNWKVSSTDSSSLLSIYGTDGSIWGTKEFRIRVFGADSPPVQNISLLANDASITTTSLSVEIQFQPSKHGSQAGIVFYQDDLNWVKLVYEGNKTHGTMVIFAIQVDGEAEILHKVSDIENPKNTFLPMKLELVQNDSNGTVFAISGVGFNERITTPKFIPNGRLGVMAHTFDDAVEEVDRWATFRNPSI